MCGIAGLVTTRFGADEPDTAWLSDLAQDLAALTPGENAAGLLHSVIERLSDGFSALMSIATVRAVAIDSALEDTVRTLADALERHERALTALSKAGRTDLDRSHRGRGLWN